MFSRAPRQSNSNHDIKGLNVSTTSSKVSPIENNHHHHHHQNIIEEKELTPVFCSVGGAGGSVVGGIGGQNSQGKLSKGGFCVY